jgi:hypothetical protein
MVKFKYDSLYTLPLVPDENDGQIRYPQVLCRADFNATREDRSLKVSKTTILQSSCGYFTDWVTVTNLK